MDLHKIDGAIFKSCSTIDNSLLSREHLPRFFTALLPHNLRNAPTALLFSRNLL